MAKKKTWKNHANAQAGMHITDEDVGMIANSENYHTIGQNGTHHGGAQSFVCSPADIRIGGMWTLNNFMVSTIPSTIVTPVPTLTLSPPVAGITNIAETVALLSAVLI